MGSWLLISKIQCSNLIYAILYFHAVLRNLLGKMCGLKLLLWIEIIPVHIYVICNHLFQWYLFRVDYINSQMKIPVTLQKILVCSAQCFIYNINEFWILWQPRKCLCACMYVYNMQHTWYCNFSIINTWKSLSVFSLALLYTAILRESNRALAAKWLSLLMIIYLHGSLSERINFYFYYNVFSSLSSPERWLNDKAVLWLQGEEDWKRSLRF